MCQGTFGILTPEFVTVMTAMHQAHTGVAVSHQAVAPGPNAAQMASVMVSLIHGGANLDMHSPCCAKQLTELSALHLRVTWTLLSCAKERKVCN